MGRRVKVWVSLILCLIMFCSNGVFVFASETETVSDLTIQSEGKGSETEEAPEITGTPEPLTEPIFETSEEPNVSDEIVVLSEGDNLCYVSAYEIDEVVDGTEPFDKNDDRGNDSSGENGIVRSFDSVNYTLKYTTAIKDSSITGIESAYVMVEFVLPCDPSVAAFNLETMQWCLDHRVTYVYEDGSTSTTWNKNKPVASQVLTGRRLLQNTEAGNTIPGTGTLSVGLKVKMAPNGLSLHPSFTIWMEGNDDTEKRTVTHDVVVSAAPKYDVAVSRNTSADILGYYNAASGQVSSARNDASDMYGRLQGYSLSLSLLNDNSQKGLKGIEIPQGTITFDVRMSESKNGQDVSYEELYQPFFWDYRMNTGTAHKGTLGRDMTPLGQDIASYTSWQTNMPFNSGSNKSYSCYNGGTMVLEQDGTDPNLIHVTLNGYQFDVENLVFPDRDNSDQNRTIGEHIGYFSIGYIQTICQFPSDVEEIENIVVGLEASNLKAMSLSGDTVTTDANPSNNLRNATVTTYPKGSHSKRNFFYTKTGNQLAVPWSAGNAYAYVGQDVQISGHMIFTGDSYMQATNILQKFDDKSFEIPAGTTRYVSAHRSNSETEIGPITTLFAAKPDKTGWVDDAEMNVTQEEQLIYFKSIDDLNAAGYTCVGVLYEVRDSKLLPNNGGGCLEIRQLVHIKSDVPSGTVSMTTNEVRTWNATNTCDFSYTQVAYDESIGAYGYGDATWTSGSYHEGYPKPTYTQYLDYGKAVYKDGTLVSGHTNGYQGGNSLLIISNRVGIGIQVNDQTEAGRKSVYDLDAGERRATFVVTPQFMLDTTNSDIYDSDIRDDVTISVTLPADLHYEETGVSVTPDDVIENADGTTRIVWTFADVLVKDGLDPIVFGTIIGEEGTLNDVVNNQMLLVSSQITSKNDIRAVSAANGNYSETSISVIKLAASSVTKRVLQPLVESGQEIGYRLRYSNLSDSSAEEAVLYDIFPYADDTMGSDFSGGYRLTRVVIDYSHASRTAQAAKEQTHTYVSKDSDARTNAVRDAALSGSFSGFTELSGTFADATFTYDGLNVVDPTAVGLSLGTVLGNEYLDVYVYLSPVAEDGTLLKDADGKTQMPGNVYGNRFYQNASNQAAVVISNVVSAAVVSREISGCVWVDADRDGVRQETEVLYEGAEVRLYRTEPSGFDPDAKPAIVIDDVPYYPAYTVFGEELAPIATDEQGVWSFSYLEGGSYVALVGDVDAYYLTQDRVGEDSTIDSDAVTEGSHYIILGIELPLLENMVDTRFSSTYWDTGLVHHTKVALAKTDAAGKLLADAHLALYDSADVVGGKVVDGAVPLFTWVSSAEEAYQLEDELLAGQSYTLVETEAPFGYLLAEPVTFMVQEQESLQTITMVDAFQTSSVTIEKLDTDGTTPLPGVTFTLTFVKAANDQPGDYLLEEGESIEATTDASGTIVFENLNRGSYEIRETETLEGYTLLAEPITVDLPLSVPDDRLDEFPHLDTSKGVLVDGVWYFFDCTYQITNDVMLQLPITGSSGFPAACLLCVIPLIGLLVFLKRRYF